MVTEKTLKNFVRLCICLNKRVFSIEDLSESIILNSGYKSKKTLYRLIVSLYKRGEVFDMDIVEGKKYFRFFDRVWYRAFPDAKQDESKEIKKLVGFDFIDFLNVSLEFRRSFRWIYEQCRRAKIERERVNVEMWHIPIKKDKNGKKLTEVEENRRRSIFLQKMTELGALEMDGRTCYLMKKRIFELGRQIHKERRDILFVHLNLLQKRIANSVKLLKIYNEQFEKYKKMEEYDMRVAAAVYCKEFSQLKFTLEDLEFEINEFGSLESLIAEYRILRNWMELDERGRASLRRFCL